MQRIWQRVRKFISKPKLEYMRKKDRGLERDEDVPSVGVEQSNNVAEDAQLLEP